MNKCGLKGKTMKKILIALLLVLCSMPTVQAFDTWTETDTKYQLTYAILHVMDWGQTLDIAKNPDTYYEKNLILGRHPSVKDVNNYFASSLVIHTVIAYMLPEEARRVWQGIWIVMEGNSVSNNFGIGLQFNFD
jgi:hypothetical protein